jgi:hypothetical protein
MFIEEKELLKCMIRETFCQNLHWINWAQKRYRTWAFVDMITNLLVR